MTQEEHLKRIVAKCRKLLAGAEKRAPGKWDYDDNSDDLDSDGGWVYAPCGPLLSKAGATHSTMDFVASCAGPAEAGWRATIAACEAIPMMEGGFTQYELAREIIAAWPEELL